ncbi:MAG: hypothetical protein WDN48_01535 [Pseudolabrys sp.]
MPNVPASGLLSNYYDHDLVARQVALGNHRSITGGKWDYLGRLQLSFLVPERAEAGAQAG